MFFKKLQLTASLHHDQSTHSLIKVSSAENFLRHVSPNLAISLLGNNHCHKD